MNNKVVFLDIDGTMIDFTGSMPKSAEYAIKEAMKNGHHMVICSGRSLYQIYPKLMEMNFNGVVAADGACVVHNGKEIFHKYMESDKRKWLVDYLEKNNFIFDIQANTKTIGSEKCIEAVKKDLMSRGVTEEMYKTVAGHIEIRKDLWAEEHAEKVVYIDSPFSLEKVRQDLSPYFEVTGSSLENESRGGEICMAGINKATGMEIYLKHIGMDRKDSIAIGDGPNDFEMLAYANIGIAMGNAREELKKVADYVTTDINDNGIYHAFVKFGLIKEAMILDV